MNTYLKYAPNVFVAKCTEPQSKGDTITLTTKYGQEHECIVFNRVGTTKDGCIVYSIVRADGYNVQERAKAKAARYAQWGESAANKSHQKWEESNEGRDFLALGEPIKVGHHSEKRHRALIERNHKRMHKSIELQDKAESHQSKAEYWESKANEINLSMPESIEYYEYKLHEAIEKHEGMKNGTVKRDHGMSLQYANKARKDMQKKYDLACKLWVE
jgi:hypothetical protein